MKLDSFKQILLKKTKNYPYINTVIELMGEDRLASMMEESLEKMARTNPNSGLLWWGKRMNKLEGHMIYDAVSHHASQYKAALKAGDEKTADKHMHKLHQAMFLLNKLTRDGNKNNYEPHTSGPDGKPKLSFEAPPTSHWERSTKGGQKKESGGLLHWASGAHRKDHDYSYLRQSPSHTKENYEKAKKEGESKGHDYSKAYPLEEIKINGKHIHVDPDAEYSGKYEPHPFDEHPVLDALSVRTNNYTGEHKSNLMGKYMDFLKGDTFRNWAKGYSQDKVARGEKKSDPVHHHINEKMKEPEFGQVDVDSAIANIRGGKTDAPTPTVSEPKMETVTDLDEISSLLDAHIGAAKAPKPEAPSTPEPVDVGSEIANIRKKD